MSKTYYFRATDGNVFSSNYPEYHKDMEQLTQSEGKRLYTEQVKQNLLNRIKPGQTIYTLCRSVSRSGMSRVISLFIVDDGRLVNIDYSASVIMGESLKDSGIKVNGCGMDMGFNLVYNLGRYLWPDGTPEPHGIRNGQPDSDGGYALKHSWI